MENNIKFEVDGLREIISRLPLKLVVQCKLLSKSVRDMISHADFARILFKRHKDISTQIIYSVYDGAPLKIFNKISLNPITQSVSTLPDEIEILASSNGLILIDFERVLRYCIFNPMTGEHQLIAYPNSSTNDIEDIGLAVEYPNADQYKLVTISKLEENSNLFYKFRQLSSEQSGVWREIQLRTNSFQPLLFGSPHVYWHDSLYWLRLDGSVLSFDTKTEEAILIDRPEFLDLNYGKIFSGQEIWIGTAQGLLTLLCIFRMYTVIATYDSANRRWRVSRTLDNFVLDQEGSFNGFPVWIDSKQVSFLLQRRRTQFYDLYEYDTNINGYENAAALHRVKGPMYCFHPTLASVHNTPSNDVMIDDHIAANLNNIRRFIIEGIPTQEAEGGGEEEFEGEEFEGEAFEGEEFEGEEFQGEEEAGEGEEGEEAGEGEEAAGGGEEDAGGEED